ncbi:GCN5 family acetyltransferase [Leucobacter muris]|uniref:GCN5 family acetyltransferase n=1 Tax=Leucobacter muris TaxID=1935379 RepID=A0ABX5QCT0_9MICO|nr:GCN5 family acetyltransferase [Leucobacter muris]QAB16833.1 GCN5 family acetyltransferase [Leucobacter muris]
MESAAPKIFDYSLKSYSDALKDYVDTGYAVTSFQKYLADPQERHMVLRHDIDNTIEQALRVARVDAEAGVSSTFFLRVHARGYNLLSLPSLQIVQEMEQLGHEVQLHLEGGLCDWLGSDNLDWADRQRAVFEAAVGRPLGGFSSHEPARTGGLEFANGLLERWSDSVAYHAYEERFMTPSMKYLSDSSGRWREGHFGEWVGKEPLMQVLTHPFWWFEKVPAENY